MVQTKVLSDPQRLPNRQESSNSNYRKGRAVANQAVRFPSWSEVSFQGKGPLKILEQDQKTKENHLWEAYPSP